VLPLTVNLRPKPPEEMTDEELGAYIAAIRVYLVRRGHSGEQSQGVIEHNASEAHYNDQVVETVTADGIRRA
jgi:hypothetical protein